MSVRVRFAPSPTGPLHIGGVRTALYNFLLARKTGGQFILRIEDTDQTRFVPGAEDYIVETLNWCGLHCDEGPHVGGDYGPYRQSERKDLYRPFAEQLVQSGHAYYAFDTPEALDDMREKLKAQGVASPQYNAITRQYMQNSTCLPADEVEARIQRGDAYVIRIKMPRNEEIRFEDQIRGWVSFQTSQLDDKVLFKSDGMPTYHLANVVDDYLMKITHVIRGEEWLPSAPLHVFLYQSFGWTEVMPKFAHLPLILKPDGHGKLSKRDGDRLGFPVFALDWTDPFSGEKSTGFRERGFFPEAFTNMLAFLGWNPGTAQELFTMDELVEAFTIDRIGKSGAKFDFEKAKWFNHQYLRQKTVAELLPLVKPSLPPGFSDDFLTGFIAQMMERVNFLAEFKTAGAYYFEAPTEYDASAISKKWQAGQADRLQPLIHAIESVESWDSPTLEGLVKAFMQEHQLGMGQVLPVLRIAMAGHMQGPPIFDMMALLGRNECVHRLKQGFAHLSKSLG